tara:strand:+ start:72 stop:1040 length:969 start_codon:yes stop_codon:yes gene_type:complete
MSNQKLHEFVEDGFPNKRITPVQGTYKKNIFTGKKGSFKIDKKDGKIFRKLYFIGDSNTGNGEVALFWLFNYKKKEGVDFYTTLPPTLRAKHQGGAEADLNIDDTNVEVKAYDKSFEQASKLGRWSGKDPEKPGTSKEDAQKRQLKNLIQALFLIDNVLNKEAENMSDVKSFDIRQLRDASDAMCKARFAVEENRKILEDIEFFKGLLKRLDALKKMFFDLDLKDCLYKEGDTKPVGGEDIAALIIQRIIELVIQNKPGNRGYVANLKPQNFKTEAGDMKVEFIQIVGKPSLEAIKVITTSTTTRKVYFSDNDLFLAFSAVF